MAEKLYYYKVDRGRSGVVEGLFVASPEELDKIVKHTIHFGEVLGKHSEVSVDFTLDDFQVVSHDPVLVNKLRKAFSKKKASRPNSLVGHNPLDYMEK